MAADTKFAVTFRNTDGTLIQYYFEDQLAVGEVPAFTARTPIKAPDSEGSYVFLGFDKEIVPYEASATEKTYTAVYQKRQYTITGVALEMIGDKLVYSITGTSLEHNPTITMRHMIKGGSWTTSTMKQFGELSYNSDGSWVVKADLLDSDNQFLVDSAGTPFIGKFRFGDSTDDEDLKVLVRYDMLRYRHTLDGRVVEVKELSEDWDGVEGYDDLPEDFKNAIPAPTWDGLDIKFTETIIAAPNGHTYKLFANEDTWNCVSLIVS